MIIWWRQVSTRRLHLWPLSTFRVFLLSVYPTVVYTLASHHHKFCIFSAFTVLTSHSNVPFMSSGFSEAYEYMRLFCGATLDVRLTFLALSVSHMYVHRRWLYAPESSSTCNLTPPSLPLAGHLGLWLLVVSCTASVTGTPLIVARFFPPCFLRNAPCYY